MMATDASQVLPSPDGMPPIYLDANATTKPLDEVLELVAAVMRDTYANAASVHWMGGEARAVVERARDGVLKLFPDALSESVVFTSGGTEGNNAILNAARQEVANTTLITSAVEHPSVLRSAEAFASMGGQLIVLPVSQDGVVDATALYRSVKCSREYLVLSIQWANSETGVIQPVHELVAIARQARPDVFVHSDVAQAVGRVWIDLNAAAVDVVTFSGHKVHGPHGVGATVFRDPDERRVAPFIVGGGQERGRRSGTQNVAGAAGLGLAVSVRAAGYTAATAKLAAMRDVFEQLVIGQVQQACVNGARVARVPNTSSIRFAGVEAMELVARLDTAGIACSLGSACSAAKPEPSHVLTAMGLPELDAFSSVRFSFSIHNTIEESERAARIVAEIVRGIS